jgi:hypothetical protein
MDHLSGLGINGPCQDLSLNDQFFDLGDYSLLGTRNDLSGV